MTVRALSRGTLLGALALLALAAGCGYSPSPKAGTLKCSADATCPEGYQCDQQYCWRPSLFGHWTFVAPSTRKIVCGATAKTEDWSNMGEFFDIDAGGPGTFTTYYYCNWDLDLGADEHSTKVRPAQSCSGPDPTDATITYTWHGEAFTLSSTDGKHGTLDASLPYDYVTLTGAGSCTMHFTGTVTKS